MTTTTATHRGAVANPLEHASQLSQWFFLWAWPLLALGSQRPLEPEDLPDLLPEDSSSVNRQTMAALLEGLTSGSTQTNTNQSFIKPTSLFRILLRDYFQTTWYAQILLVISMVFRIGQALALRFLLNELEQPSQDEETTTSSSSSTSAAGRAYTSAAVMIVCGFGVFVTKQRQFFLTYRKGMQTRVGLVACLYHKTLDLSSTQTTTTSSSHGSNESAGHAMNLASNDVERFVMASIMGMYLVWGPLEALLILGLGIYIMGAAFAAGFGLFMIVLLPLQFYLSQLFAHLRQQVS